MARISLILPNPPGRRPPGVDRRGPLRDALERAGHSLEILTVEEGTGMAAAAIAGLRIADGDVLLVLDPCASCSAEDLARVAQPLLRGQADLALATRGRVGRDGVLRTPGGPWPMLVHALAGTTAPRSGLVGLTRAAWEAVREDFRPAGGTFAFELLARVQGRWVEVAVGKGLGDRAWRPGLDDLRQWKRLADHRFGNASRLIQFCAVGGSGMVVDLSCYLAFQPLWSRTALASWTVPPTKVSAALAVSRALAIAVALVWNFSLNRRLTFSYARSGSLARQFVTYVLSNALGIALSLVLSLGLPRKVAFFQAHKLAAAVVGIVAATGVSFSMSRWLVFRRRDGEAESAPDRASPRATSFRRTLLRAKAPRAVGREAKV